MCLGLPGAFLLSVCVLGVPGILIWNASGQEPEARVGSPKSVKHLPPNHVRVKVTPGGMQISWDPPQTTRIVAFVVYRLDGDKWIKIAPDVRGSNFTDHDNKDPAARYSVASVDVSGVEGRRSPPVEGR